MRSTNKIESPNGTRTLLAGSSLSGSVSSPALIENADAPEGAAGTPASSARGSADDPASSTTQGDTNSPTTVVNETLSPQLRAVVPYRSRKIAAVEQFMRP